MYAVVKTGGKQYRVSPGDVIVVEKLLGDAGAKVKLDQVLMVGEDGKDPELGAPLLTSTAVNCEVVDQSRSDKIIVFKKKRRQGYKRTKGHRQDQTVLRVLDINGKGAVKAAVKKDAAPKADTKAEKKPTAKAKTEEKPKVKAKASAKKDAAPKADTKTEEKPKVKAKAPAKKKAAAVKKKATVTKKKAAPKKKTAAKKKDD
ncbi:MAG: 50S ribosomal protein L21 [Acidobacteria bacterium]|nr:50S ribosomal protein L21 [Acidobacteriota bacterium]